MITEMQLELNWEEKDPIDIRIFDMQKQIDLINESMGKTRRRLFAEMSEMKKICTGLKTDTEELKNDVRCIKNQKTEWTYFQDGNLFTAVG